MSAQERDLLLKLRYSSFQESVLCGKGGQRLFVHATQQSIGRIPPIMRFTIQLAASAFVPGFLSPALRLLLGELRSSLAGQ
jgi:hypothetical protein